MKNSVSSESEKKKLLKRWFWLKWQICEAARKPDFKEGEIWWCIFGENIDVGLNGKQQFFLRPVLVFKKYNKHSFYGIPLTSRVKRIGSWYVHFVFREKEQVAVLNQSRSFSSSRLYERMGMMTRGDMLKVRKGLEELFFGIK